ncbi:Protein kinase domain [Dillenia turbinata]|uniref:Protein kinase domain n=1 Tax=Dillenia turbinata TaxID=194707 RepID=A0AAN8UMR4_9MAGN
MTEEEREAVLYQCLSARCSHLLKLKRDLIMNQQADLAVVGVSAGVAVSILLASIIYCTIKWYKRHSHLRLCANERSPTTPPIRLHGLDTSLNFSSSVANSNVVQGPDLIPRSGKSSWWRNRSKDRFVSAPGIPRYSYKDIQKATQNFTTLLGQGSFGPVYKAITPTCGVVAVKVLASDSKQGEKEFQTEILTWDERLQVALDISHGIEYLHEGAVPPVVHRDLKSANILLDHSMRAKIADFGLSKEEVCDGRNSDLKGTYGYIDPEYMSTKKFTMKSDIYSFGIIMFELITAIHPHQNLMDYINLAAMTSDGVDEILDKRLVGQCNLVEVRALASVAYKCLHKTPRRRPSISEVSRAILKIKQRRLDKEDTLSFASEDISRIISGLGSQNVELSKLASMISFVAYLNSLRSFFLAIAHGDDAKSADSHKPFESEEVMAAAARHFSSAHKIRFG